MNPYKSIYTGFDSAWTDRQDQPGAIASILEDHNGRLTLSPPALATFDQARRQILELHCQTDYHLVAVDQPTIVRNEKGCRPVERVVASLISKLKGGVQPANTSKSQLFGRSGPIWAFLTALPHRQEPFLAATSNSGAYLVEVFPAVALPALIPELFERTRGAKYNPDRKKTFAIEDWKLVCRTVAALGLREDIAGLNDWATEAAALEIPRKSDQDRLDGVLCALIALKIRRAPLWDSLVVGDASTGYIVCPVSPRTREVIVRAATRIGVPINTKGTWDA